jgi:RNA polymerase sigma-70 factor (ECF subfamily)
MVKRLQTLPFWGSHSEAEVYSLDFDSVYRQELPRVYNFFRFRVGDGPLAEDLTATTFEKAWRKRHHYRKDIATFSTWLFTIAKRVAVDHYRKQRLEVSFDILSNTPAEGNLEDEVIRKVEFAHLSVLLSQLADRDRELVALRYGAGLTNRAIAGLTGISESNVGVLLHRLTEKLRKQWEMSNEG